MNVQGFFTFAKLLAVFVIIVFGFTHIIQGLFRFYPKISNFAASKVIDSLTHMTDRIKANHS